MGDTEPFTASHSEGRCVICDGRIMRGDWMVLIVWFGRYGRPAHVDCASF